jgi:hypothetical protein
VLLENGKRYFPYNGSTLTDTRNVQAVNAKQLGQKLYLMLPKELLTWAESYLSLDRSICKSDSLILIDNSDLCNPEYYHK